MGVQRGFEYSTVGPGYFHGQGCCSYSSMATARSLSCFKDPIKMIVLHILVPGDDVQPRPKSASMWHQCTNVDITAQGIYHHRIQDGVDLSLCEPLPAFQPIHCTNPGTTSHALSTPKQARSKSHRPQLLPAFQVLPKPLLKENHLSRQGDDQKVESGRSHSSGSGLSQWLWLATSLRQTWSQRFPGTKMSHV